MADAVEPATGHHGDVGRFREGHPRNCLDTHLMTCSAKIDR